MLGPPGGDRSWLDVHHQLPKLIAYRRNRAIPLKQVLPRHTGLSARLLLIAVQHRPGA